MEKGEGQEEVTEAQLILLKLEGKKRPTLPTLEDQDWIEVDKGQYAKREKLPEKYRNGRRLYVIYFVYFVHFVRLFRSTPPLYYMYCTHVVRSVHTTIYCLELFPSFCLYIYLLILRCDCRYHEFEHRREEKVADAKKKAKFQVPSLSYEL